MSSAGRGELMLEAQVAQELSKLQAGLRGAKLAQADDVGAPALQLSGDLPPPLAATGANVPGDESHRAIVPAARVVISGK